MIEQFHQPKFAKYYLKSDRALLMELKGQQSKMLEQIWTEKLQASPDEDLIKDCRAKILTISRRVLVMSSNKNQNSQKNIEAQVGGAGRRLNPENYPTYELIGQDFQRILCDCLAQAVIETQYLPDKLSSKELLSVKSSVSRCWRCLIREVINDLFLNRKDYIYYENPTQTDLHKIVEKLHEISTRSTKELAQ